MFKTNEELVEEFFQGNYSTKNLLSWYGKLHKRMINSKGLKHPLGRYARDMRRLKIKYGGHRLALLLCKACEASSLNGYDSFHPNLVEKLND